MGKSFRSEKYEELHNVKQNKKEAHTRRRTRQHRHIDLFSTEETPEHRQVPVMRNSWHFS